MIPSHRAVVSAMLLLFTGPSLCAQQDGSPAPLASTPAAQPATAPLEERIAAARSVKVMISILGIELGSELDEAHEKLDRLCAPGTHPKEEGEEDEEKKRDNAGKKDGAGGESSQREHEPKRGEEQEEGHKVLWQLGSTDYSAIYITADAKEHIDSITGFLRPEKQLPFDQVGETAKAPVKDGNAVLWDVLRPGQPLFRVAASGTKGKASSIRIFVVRRKSGGTIPYNGMADEDSHK